MKQYLELLEDIMENGVDKGDRTGTGTRSVFGRQMRFNLQEGFPLITTKKLHLKSIIHELLWFIKGDTNIKYLNDNGVTIWDEWADEKGELGPVYGKQWRAWRNFSVEKSMPDSYGENYQINKKQDIDQLSWVIDRLKTNPDCRRIIVSAWNVADIPNMALAPCHCLFQFYTSPFKTFSERVDAYYKNGGELLPKYLPPEKEDEYLPTRKLSCQLYQRSCDTFLGVPFNIASYALLTMMVAQCVNMVPGEFIWTGGDTHIYSNHFEQVREQLSREPFSLPKMKINPDVKDIFSFKYEDFTLENYQCHPRIKAPISV